MAAYQQEQTIAYDSESGLERANDNIVRLTGSDYSFDMDRSGYNSVFIGGTDQTIWLNLCTPNTFYAMGASDTAFEVDEILPGNPAMTIYDFATDPGGHVQLLAGETATAAPYMSSMQNGWTWGTEVTISNGASSQKLDFAYDASVPVVKAG